MKRQSSDDIRRRRCGFRRNRDGVAAVEFAFLLPIMITLFFGMLEASDALMNSRRVSSASNALVDLVAQSNLVTESGLDSAFLSVSRSISPTAGSSLGMRLISVMRDPANTNRIMVVWSRDQAGNAPYSPNSTYSNLADPTIVPTGVALVVAEVNYDYASRLTMAVIQGPIEFRRTVARWPRRSSSVCFQGASGPPVC